MQLIPLDSGADQPQDQLTELLQELGMIETQQEKLRDAVRHNKGIVVHPRHEVRVQPIADTWDWSSAVFSAYILPR